ncbi:MAG: copper oxidase [Aeromicrobium sp.]|nr:MAG: copper oxidase [Aeromicrobium sp.]
MRANAPIAVWLVAVVVTTMIHPFVDHASWLMVHTLMLGVVTNAIVVWSSHFAETLGRANPTLAERRWHLVRLALLNISVIAVLVGRMVEVWLVLLIGAVAIGLVVTWHGIVIALRLRSKLANRFAASLTYYVVAAGLLPIGAGLGAWLAYEPKTAMAANATLAHATINVLGWIGLTVAGTLVTLWPTILRTKMADGAVTASKRALPVLVIGVVVIAMAALIGERYLGAAGVAIYTAGWVVAMLPWLLEARQRPPHSYAALSLAFAVAWLLISLVWWFTVWVSFKPIAAIEAQFSSIVPALAAGFAAQIVLGALSHLIPVVLGGGPASARAANDVMDRAAGLRLTVINVGLVICLLPVPSIVRVLVSTLVLVAFMAFLPLAFGAMRASRAARGTLPPVDRKASQERIATAQEPARHRVWIVAGAAVLALSVAIGIAADPSALPGKVSAIDGGVQATGETTKVTIEARDMRFFPNSVDVPAGNRLVITLKNTDKADAHDLAFETGQRTARLAPGESETLDLGVVGTSLDGWCTVVGHRQMGMTFDVNVTGGSDESNSSGSGDDAMSGHDGHSMGGTTGTGAAADLDFMAPAPKGFVAADPRPPTPSTATTHRETITVSNMVADVAPGVRQKLWTFNKSAPGPTLRGKVGDRFIVTLVNDTDMAHSIDFHASRVAPDRLMKSIGPGEKLVYEFTADHSGIWMYHCGTMPMGVHIANGLFGAVIIDPPNLPKVDREYLMIQSELYLGQQGGTLDANKLNAETPDAVVFNGYVNQYKYDPVPAKVGERVRFWVLNAGPNRSSSFHVIGTQFDTVWFEGDYMLKPNNASKGGSQSLGMEAAQGGFVEMTFPEPGKYPFVSHRMIDAERGATGIVEVTR